MRLPLVLLCVFELLTAAASVAIGREYPDPPPLFDPTPMPEAEETGEVDSLNISGFPLGLGYRLGRKLLADDSPGDEVGPVFTHAACDGESALLPVEFEAEQYHPIYSEAQVPKKMKDQRGYRYRVRADTKIKAGTRRAACRFFVLKDAAEYKEQFAFKPTAKASRPCTSTEQPSAEHAIADCMITHYPGDVRQISWLTTSDQKCFLHVDLKIDGRWMKWLALEGVHKAKSPSGKRCSWQLGNDLRSFVPNGIVATWHIQRLFTVKGVTYVLLSSRGFKVISTEIKEVTSKGLRDIASGVVIKL